MTTTLTTIETLYGSLSVPNWPDDLIVRSLRQLGEWCAAEAILAAAAMQPNESLWDAGAFLGTFSLGVTACASPSKVIAIEANPEVIPALEHNLTLPHCPVELVASGLSGHQGWLTTANEVPGNHGATAFRYCSEKPDNGLAIRSQTLPALRALHGDYDFLKLDIEGMELDVLRPDFAYLKARRPVIWAECNEDIRSLALHSAMKWLGYEVLYLGFPAFRRANFRASSDLIYPMAYEAALVAAPPERLAAVRDQAESLVPGEDVIMHPVVTSFDLRQALFDTPRWAKIEWVEMNRAQLIARLGRVITKTSWGSYLRNDVLEE